VTYSAWWVFGREPYSLDLEQTYAARTGTGDGLIRFSAGSEIPVGTAALLFEYSFMLAAVDDPGDFYSFRNSHGAALGLRF